MLAAIFKGEPGTRNEVLHGLRDQDFRWIGQSSDPTADADCYAPHFVGHRLHFSGMQSRPNLDPERPHRLHSRLSAPHRSCRTVEGGEESVAGRLDLAAAIPCEGRTHRGVVTLDEVTPTSVSELGDLLRRLDDVGEEHGRENSVEVGLFRPHSGEEALHLTNDCVGIGCPWKWSAPGSSTSLAVRMRDAR